MQCNNTKSATEFIGMAHHNYLNIAVLFSELTMLTQHDQYSRAASINPGNARKISPLQIPIQDKGNEKAPLLEWSYMATLLLF